MSNADHKGLGSPSSPRKRRREEGVAAQEKDGEPSSASVTAESSSSSQHSLAAAADGDEGNVGTNTTVYIGNLPNQYCAESVVEKIMSKYGDILRCSIVKNYCFCEFASAQAAAAAIQGVHGRKLGGQRLTVRPAHRQHDNKRSTPPSSSSSPANHNPKRQKQQIESKIQAIKRQLAAKQQSTGGR